MQLNSFVRLTNDFFVCVGGPQRPTSFTNGRGRRATTTATLQYCTAPPGGGTAFDCTFLVGHSPLPSFSRRCSGLDSRVSRDKTHLSRIVHIFVSNIWLYSAAFLLSEHISDVDHHQYHAKTPARSHSIAAPAALLRFSGFQPTCARL